MDARLDLFAFDLAGTTVVDDDHVLRALLATCAAHAVPVAPATLRQRMGWHKQQVFEAVLRDAGMDEGPAAAMARRFEREFSTLVAAEPLRPTAGALATIAALGRAGVRVAFTTGFSRATADVVLRAMGWHGLPSVASDEVARGRPAPDLIHRAMSLTGIVDAARVGVAGDTPADLEAGAAAGAGCIVGVGCGTHRLADLERFPHTHLLPDLTMLTAIVLGEAGA